MSAVNPLTITTTKYSKAGIMLGAVGASIAGIAAYKKGKSMTVVAVSAAIFGVAGFLIGNAVTKFYTPS